WLDEQQRAPGAVAIFEPRQRRDGVVLTPDAVQLSAAVLRLPIRGIATGDLHQCAEAWPHARVLAKKLVQLLLPKEVDLAAEVDPRLSHEVGDILILEPLIHSIVADDDEGQLSADQFI